MSFYVGISNLYSSISAKNGAWVTNILAKKKKIIIKIAKVLVPFYDLY